MFVGAFYIYRTMDKEKNKPFNLDEMIAYFNAEDELLEKEVIKVTLEFTLLAPSDNDYMLFEKQLDYLLEDLEHKACGGEGLASYRIKMKIY